ncbi:MAG: hypothetical protein HFJ48_03715 [Clostridia bacterium]|nr:hypothetical protein [Clostridia bacterium]
MRLVIEYNSESYVLTYNSQSGYYEIELEAKNAGVNKINVKATDILGTEITDTLEFQVLALLGEDKNAFKEKDIAYILDYKDLRIKDIQKITNFNIELDDETNAASTIAFANKFNAEEKDYILLKKEYNDFLGIFSDLTELKTNNNYTASIKDISNIFDEKLFLTDANVIKTTGIEDFIKLTIENYFSKTYDSFTNLDYIQVIVKTHTKLNKSVETDEFGLYNFHTFITNCKQNYDIHMDYEIKNGILEICIEKKEQKAKFIDCTVADVLNYKRVYGMQITSKVEVLSTDTNSISRYCLTADNKVQLFEETAEEDRVEGKVARAVVENLDEAYQTAVDQFKGNNYEYLIEFSLNKNSLIMPPGDLKIGTPVKLKTKENNIVSGYITARTEIKDNNIINFKAGKIRRTLRQQLQKREVEK